MENALMQKPVNYVTRTGDEMKLTPAMLREYGVRGKKELVTMQELVFFLHVCRAKKVNPLAGDCYLVKYGSDPAAIIIGREYYQQLAMEHPRCEGWTYGIVIETKEGNVQRREGTIVYDGEKLLGGWAETYVQGWKIPKAWEVPLKGYIKTTRDGRPTQFWSEDKQGHMIAKVALVQLLREVYDNGSGGAISPEEMHTRDSGRDFEMPAVVESPAKSSSISKSIGPADPYQPLVTSLAQMFDYHDESTIRHFVSQTAQTYQTDEASIISDALRNLHNFHNGLLKFKGLMDGKQAQQEPIPEPKWYDQDNWKALQKNGFTAWVMDNQDALDDIPADATCNYQGSDMPVIEGIKAKWETVNPESLFPGTSDGIDEPAQETATKTSFGDFPKEIAENRQLKRDFPDEWKQARDELKMGGAVPITVEGAKIWNAKIGEILDNQAELGTRQ